jgi:hypothetical protein
MFTVCFDGWYVGVLSWEIPPLVQFGSATSGGSSWEPMAPPKYDINTMWHTNYRKFSLCHSGNWSNFALLGREFEPFCLLFLLCLCLNRTWTVHKVKSKHYEPTHHISICVYFVAQLIYIYKKYLAPPTYSFKIRHCPQRLKNRLHKLSLIMETSTNILQSSYMEFKLLNFFPWSWKFKLVSLSSHLID